MKDNEIEVPADEVRPIDEVIAPGVVGLRVAIVNLFAIASSSGWTLVDAALRGSAGRIRRWATDHFGEQPPDAIVLTHGHFDHVGALESLLDQWDVPVYSHELEMPYVTGRRAYPPPDPSVGGGLMARMAGLYPRAPIDIGNRVRPLPEDGSVPPLPGWRWIHTPGHSAGHVSLFHDGDRSLVVGDAFCTTKQESMLAAILQTPELHGPPAYFTTDWDAARRSVEALAALRPFSVAPGHGRPMVGPHVADTLAELADRFEQVAVPERGRYVKRPVTG